MGSSHSPTTATEAFSAFVSNLPPNVDPFNATAQWLIETQSAATAKDPAWAQIVMHVILAAYVLLLVLTSVLIYLRVANGHFSIGSVTRYGLWRPNAPNCMAILMGLFSALTISSLTLQLTGGEGHDNYVKVSALYGIKFITIYLAAWVFCWACACQCALASWERPWYDSLRRPIRPPSGFHTPDVVRWMINITFPLVAITSTSVIVWAFVMAQLTFRSLCNALQRVHVSLMTASQSYDPETYQIVQLLEAMKPAVPIPGILINLNIWYRLSGKMWLTFLLVFLAIYTPLLLATPRAMRKQSDAHFKTRNERPSSRELQRKFSFGKRPVGNTNIEYIILLMMGWFVELASLSYVPMIAWQLSFTSLDYLKSQAFLIVANIGAHGFVSITSNIVMVMAITQTRRLLTRSAGASTSRNTSILGSLPGSVKPLHQEHSVGLDSPELKGSFKSSLLIAMPENAYVKAPDPSVDSYYFCPESRHEEARGERRS